MSNLHFEYAMKLLKLRERERVKKKRNELPTSINHINGLSLLRFYSELQLEKMIYRAIQDGNVSFVFLIDLQKIGALNCIHRMEYIRAFYVQQIHKRR